VKEVHSELGVRKESWEEDRRQRRSKRAKVKVVALKSVEKRALIRPWSLVSGVRTS
jgi:hypothetical protein